MDFEFLRHPVDYLSLYPDAAQLMFWHFVPRLTGVFSTDAPELGR